MGVVALLNNLHLYWTLLKHARIFSIQWNSEICDGIFRLFPRGEFHSIQWHVSGEWESQNIAQNLQEHKKVYVVSQGLHDIINRDILSREKWFWERIFRHNFDSSNLHWKKIVKLFARCFKFAVFGVKMREHMWVGIATLPSLSHFQLKYNQLIASIFSVYIQKRNKTDEKPSSTHRESNKKK